MGVFDNLFGAKGTENQLASSRPLVSAENELGRDGSRSLNSEQREALEKSTLPLMATQLYMHYWLPDLSGEDSQDQTWRNQVMFFWKAEEPFPKKSLPPVFETFQVKTFVFAGDTSAISLQVAQAMPWFGMPGLGEKHVCLRNDQEIAIPELHRLGIVKYVEVVELTPHNLALLTDREHYFFLIDSQLTPFSNGDFYLHGKPVALHVAYSAGGIQLVRSV